MGRPKGSRNVFRDKDANHQEMLRKEYGTAWASVVRFRKACIRKKGGCHTCAEAIENRLFGKPPQEIKPSGGKVTPMVLVSIVGGALAEPQPTVEVEVVPQTALVLAEGIEWPGSS